MHVAYIKEINSQNLEERFDADEDVLNYFETETIVTTAKLAALSSIFNLSAIAREAGINVQTLQAKVKRGTPLSGDETKRIVAVLKHHRLVCHSFF